MENMKKILIIDDDEMTRIFLGKILERMGCSVVGASNAKEGITRYKMQKPDAVFLDLILPDIHGGEVFEMLKAIDKGTKIFIISASVLELAELREKNIGADKYFFKPVNIEQIREAVAELMKDR